MKVYSFHLNISAKVVSNFDMTIRPSVNYGPLLLSNERKI